MKRRAKVIRNQQVDAVLSPSGSWEARTLSRQGSELRSEATTYGNDAPIGVGETTMGGDEIP
jgi:hypothetical protein